MLEEQMLINYDQMKKKIEEENKRKMGFKETVKKLKDLINVIQCDLKKADRGNKSAAQRVRNGTVRLQKLAKTYRKESLIDEKERLNEKKESESK